MILKIKFIHVFKCSLNLKLLFYINNIFFYIIHNHVNYLGPNIKIYFYICIYTSKESKLKRKSVSDVLLLILFVREVLVAYVSEHVERAGLTMLRRVLSSAGRRGVRKQALTTLAASSFPLDGGGVKVRGRVNVVWVETRKRHLEQL